MRTLAVLLILMSAKQADSVIIDRIAMVIYNRPIKDSDIDREIRVTAFLNGDPLLFTPAERKKAAQRLIDQRIILREVELGNYSAASDEEVAAFLKSAALQNLGTYGLAERELRTQVGWQIAVLHFIELRFRPAVNVSDADLAKYAKTHPKEARPQIEESLIEQKVTDAFNSWLDRAHKRVPVEYREEDLR